MNYFFQQAREKHRLCSLLKYIVESVVAQRDNILRERPDHNDEDRLVSTNDRRARIPPPHLTPRPHASYRILPYPA